MIHFYEVFVRDDVVLSTIVYILFSRHLSDQYDSDK